MSEVSDTVVLEALQDEADIVFPVWASNHKSDFISVIPSDRDDEHQDISIVSFEAEPSLEIAAGIGRMGLGAVCETITEDLQRLGVVDLAKKRISQGRSLMFSSLHLTSVLDAAASHNQLFVASEDESFADRNVLLANPMLAWTAIKGAKTMFALRKAGRIVRGIPLDGAEKYGLSTRLVTYVDKKAAPILVNVFKEGNAVHRAPSGTRAKKIRLEDGRTGYCIPRLEEVQARTIRKRTNKVVGMPMDVQGEDTVAAVLEPRDINTDDDVHVHIEEMVERINDFPGYLVFYGMPDGAVEIKND